LEEREVRCMCKYEGLYICFLLVVGGVTRPLDAIHASSPRLPLRPQGVDKVVLVQVEEFVLLFLHSMDREAGDSFNFLSENFGLGV
jgi:hypothetical protein